MHLQQDRQADSVSASPLVVPSLTDPMEPPDFRSFAAPSLPINPILSWGNFLGPRRSELPSILDAGKAVFLTSGRMAIGFVIRMMGLKPGDSVLVPSYHCSSMVVPFTHLGVKVLFYSIRPDLSVDMTDVERRRDNTTRAMLIAHYFGFLQDMGAVRTFCDKHGLALIEDCAHAFYGSQNGMPVGSVGDYAIGSLMKFFPVYDGGCVVSARHQLNDPGLESCGTALQLRAITNSLQRAFLNGRLPPLDSAFKVARLIKRGLGQVTPKKPDWLQIAPAPVASEGAFAFDEDWLNKRMSLVSRTILKMSSGARICTLRRRNYKHVVEQLSGHSRCRPLQPELPPDVVPYVVPILLDDPDPLFWNLRRDGLPLLRWELLDDTLNKDDYPVTKAYSRMLVQIPCHQELREDEIRWMTTKFRRALDTPSPPKSAA